MLELNLHEKIQTYFDMLYGSWHNEIKQSMFGYGNEVYGELYYYSVVKLLKHLNITTKDHFLDLGSGLGKLAFQVFLTTNAASVTGVEINHYRANIACKVKEQMLQTLPELFNNHKKIELLEGDFLQLPFDNISIIYVCNTIFSSELLKAISKKINGINSVQKIVSLRKLPFMNNFKLTKKLFLHATWDKSICYLYCRS